MKVKISSKKIQECGVLNSVCCKCVCGTGMYHVQIHQMLVLYLYVAVALHFMLYAYMRCAVSCIQL